MHFLSLNLTLHCLLVFSLSVESLWQIRAFALFDDYVPCSSYFSLALCMLFCFGVCAKMAVSVLYLHSRDLNVFHQLWALLGPHSLSPLYFWDSNDTHPSPYVYACFSLTFPSSSIGQTEYFLVAYFPVYESSFLLCLTYRLCHSVIMIFLFSRSFDYFPIP